MALFLRKFPYNDVIVIIKGQIDRAMGRANTADDNVGKATDDLAKWSESIIRQAEASPVAPEPAVQYGPGTSLGTVSGTVSGNFGGTLVAGLYTIKAYREVYVADPVNSSLALEIQWTHNGKALTRILSAFAGVPQTTSDSVGDVEVIEIDPNTTIGFTATYASNTPGLAEFHMTLISQLDQTVS